ncbi:hypothetical protein IH601_09610 [Candidatus Bipolaricaulota bacterium]|nr:hypothetical protein [Candidatus Bipolaricaulota bacterium]TFH08940.1 MAG: hypothetical protein E4H08_06805 [Candidatus Atribacteria bacterium]
MNRTSRFRALALCLALVVIVAGAIVGQAQDTPERPASENRPAQVDLFGGSAYEGGHLKYSYKVSREGVEGYSITTTEIIPQEDGMYRIESSSTDLVPLSGVGISFFGISLRGLGFRAPTSTGGTVDLSPLSAIEDEILEPNHEYVLPDGGFLVAGDAGTIAGLDVVYATYTHADYSNVLIHLAMPVDLTIRNLLPLFPYLELEYQAADGAAEATDDDPEGMPHMRSFSQVELIEFVYEP